MAFHPKRGLRQRIRNNEPVFGILCAGASPRAIEINALARVDYLLLDGEHDDGADIGDMLPLIRAADAFGVPVIVRIPSNRHEHVQRVLDYGAIGICVPHIRDAADAAQAVTYAKYPPAGDRAMSPYVRAAGYGVQGTWEEYWHTANDEVVVMVLIEDREALEHTEAIAAVPDLDVLWIGTGDLSQSLGVPGSHPSLAAARERGLRAAREHGVAAYSPLSSAVSSPPETRRSQVQTYLDQGYRVFAWNDAGLYTTAIDALVQARTG